MIYATPSVTTTFVVSPKNQIITFVKPSPHVYTPGGSFGLAATAPGGTVAFSSSNTNVISISGNTANIIGVGNSVVTATQGGNTNYAPAPPLQRTVTITKAH